MTWVWTHLLQYHSPALCQKDSPIDGTLTDTTIPCQSVAGSNGNEYIAAVLTALGVCIYPTSIPWADTRSHQVFLLLDWLVYQG